MRSLPPVLVHPMARAVFAFAAMGLSGCSVSQSPQFRLQMEGRDPGQVSLAQAEALTRTLERLFGTPAVPKVPEGVDLQVELLRAAAGPIGGDALGNQRGLYRRHCAVCHGISGDGAGPAAALLNPYPRDFRNGTFKYTSTAGGAKPVRADLERILLRGVPGTAMPSLAVLPPQEIDALLEYVKYLSIRGQTELYLFQLVVDEDAYLPLNLGEVIKDGVLPAAESWVKAESMVVVPPEPPPIGTPEQLAASIAKGRRWYASKDTQCMKCHGPNGDGNGEETELYDDWNKRKKGVTPQQTRELARRFTLPIQRIRPRNFTEGTFRGGGRPIDAYWRIYVGIKGTPMPAAGPAPGSSGVLTPEDIWHVVNYVRSLAGSSRPSATDRKTLAAGGNRSWQLIGTP